MASEKYYKVMNTDFEAEAAKSMNNIFDIYNETIDLVNSDDLTLFNLDEQLGFIRWTERAMTEKLEDFKAVIQARKERREKKELSKVHAGNPV